MRKVDFCISNYYGRVVAYEMEGKHYLTLGDYADLSYVPITKKFFEMAVEEFGEDEIKEQDKEEIEEMAQYIAAMEKRR